MTVFELDPNTVRPGWTALIIVIVLAVIMVGLFLSMRRQMRKIRVAEPSDGSVADDQGGADEAAAHGTDDDPGRSATRTEQHRQHDRIP